jgi:hypothetical protein
MTGKLSLPIAIEECSPTTPAPSSVRAVPLLQSTVAQ